MTQVLPIGRTWVFFFLVAAGPIGHDESDTIVLMRMVIKIGFVVSAGVVAGLVAGLGVVGWLHYFGRVDAYL